MRLGWKYHVTDCVSWTRGACLKDNVKGSVLEQVWRGQMCTWDTCIMVGRSRESWGVYTDHMHLGLKSCVPGTLAAWKEDHVRMCTWDTCSVEGRSRENVYLGHACRVEGRSRENVYLRHLQRGRKITWECVPGTRAAWKEDHVRMCTWDTCSIEGKIKWHVSASSTEANGFSPYTITNSNT
jgi:hypothetical protein